MESIRTAPRLGGAIHSTSNTREDHANTGQGLPFHSATVPRAPAAALTAEDDSDSVKQFRILAAFASGDSLSRFAAEPLGDHCLPTTISNLQGRFGITFAREMRSVPNRFGKKTSVMHYWLEGEQIDKARQVLATGRRAQS